MTAWLSCKPRQENSAMSYILDALKKADSERKLGSIPNVYAQPLPGITDNATASVWNKWLPWLLALFVFAVIGTGVAWLQPWRSQPVPARNLPNNFTPPVRLTIPPVIQPTASPPPLAASLPASAPTAASVNARVNTRRPPSAANQADEKPVGSLQDLPENIQRELPAIVISGYIYAKNPADRSVLIDKRLLHEGDQISPELVLEKMMPNGAVLNYNGYRYRVAY
ncbi:MAG: general secretion pathway protein GspB [Burkholderiales bacterium]